MNKNFEKKHHVYIPLNIGNINTILVILFFIFLIAILVYSLVCLMILLPKERNLQEQLVIAMDIKSGYGDSATSISDDPPTLTSSRKSQREVVSLEDNTQSCSNGFTTDQYNNIIRCPLSLDTVDEFNFNIQDQNLDIGPIYVDDSLISRTYPHQFFGFMRDDTPRVFDPVEFMEGSDECTGKSPRHFFPNSTSGATASIRPVGQHMKCIQPAYVGTGVLFVGHPGDTFDVEMTINMGNLAFDYFQDVHTPDKGFSSIFPGQDDPDTIKDNNFVATNAIYSLVAVCTVYNGTHPILGNLNCQSAPIYHSEYTIGTLPELFNAGDSRNSYIEPKTIRTVFTINKNLPFYEPVGVRCHPVLVYDVPDLTAPRWSNDPKDGRNTQFQGTSTMNCGVCRNSYNYVNPDNGVSEQGDFPQNWNVTCPITDGFFHKKSKTQTFSICSFLGDNTLCSLDKFYSNYYKTSEDDYGEDDDNKCTSGLPKSILRWQGGTYNDLLGVEFSKFGDDEDGGDDDDGNGGDDDDTPASNKYTGDISKPSDGNNRLNCNPDHNAGGSNCVCAGTLDTRIGCPDSKFANQSTCPSYTPISDSECIPLNDGSSNECPVSPIDFTGCKKIGMGEDTCYNMKTITNSSDYKNGGGYGDDDDDDTYNTNIDYIYADRFGMFDTRCMTPETSRCCRLVNNANLYITSTEFVVRLMYTESAYTSATLSASMELFPGQSCYDSIILNSIDDTPTWCGVNERFSLLKECDFPETLPLPNDISINLINDPQSDLVPPDERASASQFGVRYTGQCHSNY